LVLALRLFAARVEISGGSEMRSPLFLSVAAMLLIATAWVYTSGAWLGRLFVSPTNVFAPVSTPAQEIVDLSFFVLEVTGAVFVVVFTLLTYAIVKFRNSQATDGREPAQVFGSTQLELGGR
jgi:heme/copper-type cytochrome/quinol oxidase subunit 2